MKLSEGGIPVCKYCGFADTQAVPRQCCAAGSDYDALAARLAEAEALLRIAQKSCDRETAACISAFLSPDSATHRETERE